jgi:asparagine synthase (glutamine-hydrolysing)
MSAQFGRWSFHTLAADPEYLAKVRRILCPYAPDEATSYSNGGVDLLFHAFRTTKQSRLETQPHVSAAGAILMWDGRLDNRAELIGLLGGSVSIDPTDVSLVAAAYERWGTDCFAKLIGDWAASIWDPREQTLILAKDPIGARHLFYCREKGHLTWSTILDPLVLFSARSVELDEEYIAGWLAGFPAAHRTPYAGIHAVPPSSFIFLNAAGSKIVKYWDFDPSRRIRYANDAEYEEHFRMVFAESVRRRLCSDTPVLAELSGGMDSSSIVSMADVVLDRGNGETPRLDTVSYYDDSEPNWNERPYFTKVEDQRGRTGCHINVAGRKILACEWPDGRLAATPASLGGLDEPAREFAACLSSHGNRVLLSGIGGDEMTGGVPTPTPQLADLLAKGELRPLAHQLKIWALDKRKPWLRLLFDAAQQFLPSRLARVPEHKRPAPWLNPNFVARHWAALTGRPSRWKLLGSLPSFQGNASTLDTLRRQLSCAPLPYEPPYERRYPYLDRSLLEFIWAIPREQLVRPGQRRSLMRRALCGIVPDGILNRKRKAFVARAPLAAVLAELPALVELSQSMVSSSLGIVDARRLSEAFESAGRGQQIPIVPLLRTLGAELWLRHLTDLGILKGCSPRAGAAATSGPSSLVDALDRKSSAS